MKTQTDSQRRLTLEKLRVKALHNELSGRMRYESVDGCRCAVGALLPRDVLEGVKRNGQNSGMVRDALRPFAERVKAHTGLGLAELDEFQTAHDCMAFENPEPGDVRAANRRVLRLVTSKLTYLYL